MNIISLPVTEADIQLAKAQVEAFERIDAGQWRYSGVEAWRGIVCELITSKWLSIRYEVTQAAKGLDASGIVDDCDLWINGKKVEIKAATKVHFKYLMPKIHDIKSKPKDVYIGTRYDEISRPNQVQIIGFLKYADVLKFPIKKNKGAPYYEIPLTQLQPFKTME